MVDGAVVVQASTQQTGRKITLIGSDTFGYIKKSVVDQLQAKSDDPELIMILSLNDGTTYSVVFTGDRFTAKTVCDNNNPNTDFPYTLSLYLMVLE